MKYRFKLQSSIGAGFPPFVSESVDTQEKAEAGLVASFGLLSHLGRTFIDLGYCETSGLIEMQRHGGPWEPADGDHDFGESEG